MPQDRFLTKMAKGPMVWRYVVAPLRESVAKTSYQLLMT